MENKKLLFIWVAIAALVGALVWVGLREGSVVVIDKDGKVVQTLGAVSGPDFPGPYFGINGMREHVISAAFKNSTTTVVSVLNPNSATGTIVFLALNNTGVATSSYDFICGTTESTSAPRVGAKVTNVFYSSFDIATSSNFKNITANATTSPVYISPTGSFLCATRGSGDMDALGNDGGWDNAFTNNGNTFDGNFKVKIIYNSW